MILTDCITTIGIVSLLQFCLTSRKKDAKQYFAKKNEKSDYNEIATGLQTQLSEHEDLTDNALNAHSSSINNILLWTYRASIIYVFLCFIIMIPIHYGVIKEAGDYIFCAGFALILILLIPFYFFYMAGRGIYLFN